MDTLTANRFWQPSCSHGTYQHVAITLRSRQLLKMGTWLPETCWANCKGEIKDNTKVTSSWFLIHTELRCTVNHTSDLILSGLRIGLQQPECFFFPKRLSSFNCRQWWDGTYNLYIGLLCLLQMLVGLQPYAIFLDPGRAEDRGYCGECSSALLNVLPN